MADVLTTGGVRFAVVYHLTGTASEAAAVAEEIGIEQTIEYPRDLVTRADILEAIVGRVESLRPLGEDLHEAVLSYAVETVGTDLTQVLNVCFGNVSLKPGIRLERIELPEDGVAGLAGPRFGVGGLRELLAAPQRPLLCSALKPMGLSPAELAAIAYPMALGGVDVVKDDHGLADQPFCRFEERVARCAEAVARANDETGGRCLYAPNVTAPADELLRRARFARNAGTGALLVAPGLVGLDALRVLAADDAVALPILSHPALQGSFVLHPRHGVSHRALFGQMNRLAGADACIFPHLGGRFSFSAEDCRGLAAGCAEPFGGLRPILPVPAGGMSLARVPEMVEFYGDDMMLLIGGDLHRHGPDLAASCRKFHSLVEIWVVS